MARWNKATFIGLVKARIDRDVEASNARAVERVELNEQDKAKWQDDSGAMLDAVAVAIKKLRGPRRDRLVTFKDMRAELKLSDRFNSLSVRELCYSPGMNATPLVPIKSSDHSLWKLIDLLGTIDDEQVSTTMLRELGWDATRCI